MMRVWGRQVFVDAGVLSVVMEDMGHAFHLQSEGLSVSAGFCTSFLWKVRVHLGVWPQLPGAPLFACPGTRKGGSPSGALSRWTPSTISFPRDILMGTSLHSGRGGSHRDGFSAWQPLVTMLPEHRDPGPSGKRCLGPVSGPLPVGRPRGRVLRLAPDLPQLPSCQHTAVAPAPPRFGLEPRLPSATASKFPPLSAALAALFGPGDSGRPSPCGATSQVFGPCVCEELVFLEFLLVGVRSLPPWDKIRCNQYVTD